MVSVTASSQPRRSRAHGLSAAQLVAVGEVTKLSERSELVLQLRGAPDGAVTVTVRDRWAVEHYHVDTHGALTRPAATGSPGVVTV